jgi:DNA-binding NarL/FixJ family response regulator
MLVDAHELVRVGLCLLIEQHTGMEVVGQAGGRADALAIAAHARPDIILLDLDLRGENGLDFLPELIHASGGGRVIVLTGLLDPEEHHKAVRLGAMGLVLKDQSAGVLIAAIEKVYANEVWLTPMMVAKVLGELSRPREAVRLSPEAARIAALTTREREVVLLIGEGLKNKHIAARLSISETTVSHHLTSIFDKLGVDTRFDLVIFAYRHGLAHPPR